MSIRERPNHPLYQELDVGHWIAFNQWADASSIGMEYDDWKDWFDCFAVGIVRGIAYASEQVDLVAQSRRLQP